MDVVEQIEGVLNRATQDFDGRDDIMQRAADEIKRLRALAERAGGAKVAELVDGLLDLRDLIMRGKRCVTDTGPAVKPVIELASVHILDDAANALEALTTEPAAPGGRQEAGADAVRFLYKHGALTHIAAREAVELLTSNGFEISRRPA